MEVGILKTNLFLTILFLSLDKENENEKFYIKIFLALGGCVGFYDYLFPRTTVEPPKNTWRPQQGYSVRDLVFVNNIEYLCIVRHISSSYFANDIEYWASPDYEFPESMWEPHRGYIVGQIVSYNGVEWKAIERHISTADFALDNRYWRHPSFEFPANMWQPQTLYNKGDIVSHNNVKWQAFVDHRSGDAFALEMYNWRAPIVVPDVPLISSQFLERKGTALELAGNPFKITGANVLWLGMKLDGTRPTNEQIEEVFIDAKNLGATTIRSHTLGHSSGSSGSLLENTGSQEAWRPIDYSFQMARKYNIKIIVCFTDNYGYPNGGYHDFTEPLSIPKSEFWTNQQARELFKAYISTWLNHLNPYTNTRYKDEPSLAILEMGNELGNIRVGEFGNRSPVNRPTKEWVQDIARFIKGIDGNHLISCGLDEALEVVDTFDIPELDIYTSHYYHLDFTRMERISRKCREFNKIHYIGEYSSKFGDDWYSRIEPMISSGDLAGSLFWSLFPESIRHSDGFTLYYDSPVSQVFLKRILNSNQRVLNIPETELP